MEITDSQMEQMEALAGLRLDENERRAVRGELNRLLDDLRRLDPRGGGAEAPPTQENIFRGDRAEPSLPRELLLGQAIETDGETFLVPRTVG